MTQQELFKSCFGKTKPCYPSVWVLEYLCNNYLRKYNTKGRRGKKSLWTVSQPAIKNQSSALLIRPCKHCPNLSKFLCIFMGMGSPLLCLAAQGMWPKGKENRSWTDVSHWIFPLCLRCYVLIFLSTFARQHNGL